MAQIIGKEMLYNLPTKIAVDVVDYLHNNYGEGFTVSLAKMQTGEYTYHTMQNYNFPIAIYSQSATIFRNLYVKFSHDFAVVQYGVEMTKEQRLTLNTVKA